MLQYPEIKIIVAQMQTELVGKTIVSSSLVKSNSNMFMAENNAAQYNLLNGGTVQHIEMLAPDIYIMLDNGYGILICQSGGKILFNKSKPPKNYNIIFNFTDRSSLTYTMMLHSMGFIAISHEDWRNRIKTNTKFDPLCNNTFEDYLSFINSRPEEEIKKPTKTFLATNILGVISSFAAEILLYARVHPSVQARKLNKEQHKRIYDSMKSVLTNAYEKGGRVNEFNLYGQKGHYVAMAERKHIGGNCSLCGSIMGKITVGGVTAFCPNCQKK